MINLIPPEGQRTLKREYLLRVGAVYAFLLSTVFLAGIALFVPTYVLISTQLQTVDLSENIVKEESKEYQDAVRVLTKANSIAAQLFDRKKITLASEVIGEIEKAIPAGISLQTIQLSRENGLIPSVSVQGTAVSRPALATFKSAIEKLPRVAEAQVPISDLAKDSDLSFAITIVLKE